MANQVYLYYDEDRSGGEVCKGQENDRWASHETEYIEFHTTFLTLKQEGGFLSQPIDVDFDPNEYLGKTVWVVVARYSDGDTFGSTSGHWHIVKVCTDESQVKAAVDDTNLPEPDHNTIFKNKIWKPWWGYFASLEDVEVHEFTLQEKFGMSQVDKAKYFKH